MIFLQRPEELTDAELEAMGEEKPNAKLTISCEHGLRTQLRLTSNDRGFDMHFSVWSNILEGLIEKSIKTGSARTIGLPVVVKIPKARR